MKSVIKLRVNLFFKLNTCPIFCVKHVNSTLIFYFYTFRTCEVTPGNGSIVIFISLLPVALRLTTSCSCSSKVVTCSLLMFTYLVHNFFKRRGSVNYGRVIVCLVVSTFLTPYGIICSKVVLLNLLIPLSRFRSIGIKHVNGYVLVFTIVTSILILHVTSVDALISRSSSTSHNRRVKQFCALDSVVVRPGGDFRIFFEALSSLKSFC